MKHFYLSVIGTSIGAASVVAVLRASNALALGVQSGVQAAKGSDQPANLFGDSGVFSQISNVLLFVVGAIAVIMIVIGGLRYVVSGGDSSQVQAAKNTILYALIGVIIAILAYAAVNFFVNSFVAGGTGGVGSSSSGVNGTSTR